MRISDVYTGLFDGLHATPPVCDKGAIYLGISNITRDGHIDFSNIRYIKEEHLPKWTQRVTPHEGDIVFSYEATLNLYALIPKDFWGCLGRRLALIRTDNNKVNNKYLYYYFFSPEWRATIAQNTITGSTVDRISIANFPNLKISLPPRPIQNSIATTLSRYDNLIENYHRQIKLLEEAAQRLYKEWFVDLHFPGHENVKVIDGVPEGWLSYNIDDVFDIKYGKNLSTKEIAPTGKYPVYGANGIIGYYDKYNCDEPVVLITSRGNGSGDVLKTYERYTFVTNNSFIVKAKVDFPCCILPFTFGLVRSVNFRSVRTGAAQPQLTNASIHLMNITLPTSDLIKKYCDAMEPNFKLVRHLRNQLSLLTESRDRLLPKLMSGEIELKI